MIIDTPMLLDKLRLCDDLFGECDIPKYIPSFENAIAATLTPRQAELLRYWYSGKTDKEIAESEYMYPASVRQNIAISLRKLRQFYNYITKGTHGKTQI